MKLTNKTALAVLALGASTWMLAAQDAATPPPQDPRPAPRPGQAGPPEGAGPGERAPGPRRFRLPPPIMAALDANHDGVIDETEITNASAALRKLDKNGDGKLTRDELLPPRPPGAGPEGARGPRPPRADGPPPPRGGDFRPLPGQGPPGPAPQD